MASIASGITPEASPWPVDNSLFHGAPDAFDGDGPRALPRKTKKYQRRVVSETTDSA
jgi:hypothetical protein